MRKHGSLLCTSTETISTVRDGEPRTATSTFTQPLSYENEQVQVQCFFMSKETIRTIRDGEPRTATSTFPQLLSSDASSFWFSFKTQSTSPSVSGFWTSFPRAPCLWQRKNPTHPPARPPPLRTMRVTPQKHKSSEEDSGELKSSAVCTEMYKN